MGWTSLITQSLINTLRYGETRAGNQTTGILNSSYTLFVDSPVSMEPALVIL